MRRVVTIDGPAGAGKSTVARRLADRLGWRFLDTGAMYRAVTLAALRSGTDLTSEAALGRAGGIRSRSSLPAEAVLLDGQDVTQAIRSVEVTQASQYVADSPSVRRRLMDWQRAFAAGARRRHRGARPGDARLPGRVPQVLSDGHATRNGRGDGWPIIRRGASRSASSRCSATSASATPAMPPVRSRR